MLPHKNRIETASTMYRIMYQQYIEMYTKLQYSHSIETYARKYRHTKSTNKNNEDEFNLCGKLCN